MEKFNAYVDGFNLYKGALEKRPDLKWLDIRKFCQSLWSEIELNEIYYFTAPLKERWPGDDAPRRQHRYLRVLANDGIKVINGKFHKNENWKRTVSQFRLKLLKPDLPSHFGFTQRAINRSVSAAKPDVPKALIYEFEEKGSDVNLASYLLRDVYLNKTKNALIISGDSDLITPIKFALEYEANLKVAIPNLKQNNEKFKNLIGSVIEMHPGILRHYQFPEIVETGKGRTIRKPIEWQ